MASKMWRVVQLAGGAATTAVLVGAVPAWAGDTADTTSMAESAGAIAIEPEVQTAVEPIDLTMDSLLDESAATETATDDEATTVAADLSNPPAFDGTVSTSAETLLAEAPTATETVNGEGTEVAQVTRPLYRGITPFYVGLGGNIGIVDSEDESAIGDFGFTVISKVSLGPRFSVRPSFIVSEDETSLSVPLTYNFNPIQAGDLPLYPSAGVGADIPFDGDVGLILNGGVDVPISRQFTLNAQTNFRITDEFGMGLILGVGYNFPFFFE